MSVDKIPTIKYYRKSACEKFKIKYVIEDVLNAQKLGHHSRFKLVV